MICDACLREEGGAGASAKLVEGRLSPWRWLDSLCLWLWMNSYVCGVAGQPLSMVLSKQPLWLWINSYVCGVARQPLSVVLDSQRLSVVLAQCSKQRPSSLLLEEAWERVRP